jgi:Bacterial Ig-like domain (group 3)/Chitobiase/beta-hexosaminidase C-terminal domain/FG-GAP-like repeat
VKRQKSHREVSGRVAEQATPGTVRNAVARISILVFSRLILLALAALGIVAGVGAQALAQAIEPPNTVLKAGVVYVYGTSNIGTGNAICGKFGNGGGATFDIAITNSEGDGGQFFVFQSNGDGSFSLLPSELPTGYTFGNINDGLNLIVAGPVVSPSSLDLVVTDDFDDLYLMKGNGDGTFQTPVSLGQIAYTLSSFLNSSGTLNLVISYQTFPRSGELSVVDVLANNNDGSGTFTVQTVPTPVSPNVLNAYPLNADDLTAVLLVYVGGTAAVSQFKAGAFQTPVAQQLDTPNGISGPVSIFTSQGSTYFSGIANFPGTPSTTAAYIWPVTTAGGEIGIGSPSSYQIPTGDAASVTIADLDGDGNPDLIVLGGGQFSSIQTINLFLSNAGNSLTPFSPALSQGAPDYIYGRGVYGTEAIVADANGDGKNDLILYEPNQGITVLLNQGNGLFVAPTTYPAGNTPVALARADFNGDGLDDLAVANGVNPATDTSDNTVSVFLSQSAGVYAPQVTYPVGDFPIAVATGKVNGNQSIFVLSDEDATGNGSNPVFTYLQGSGNGSFQSPADIPISANLGGAQPTAIAAGGFDSSGNATIAIANSAGTIELFTYQAGVYAPSAVAPILAAPGGPAFGFVLSSLAVADVNGDGNQDLIATLRGQCGYVNGNQTLTGGAVLIFLGNGNGTFQSPVSITSQQSDSDPAAVALGSFVSGVLPDMLVVDGGGQFCNGHTPYPIVFSNVSQGGSLQFRETDLISPIVVDGTINETQVSLKSAIADVNGDGFNDIVLSGAGLVDVLVNNGSGGFGSPTPGSPAPDVGSATSAALTTGSFFSPGGHDVAMASPAGAVIIAANAPALSPAPTPVISPPGGSFPSPQTVTIADSINGAAIFYTTDGTMPSTSSTPYTGAITVRMSETINAIATAPGFSQSAVATAIFTIPSPTTTVLMYSPTTVFSGEPVTLTASVSSGGSPVSGSVTFSENGATIAVVALSPSGVASFTISSLPVGANILEAAYAGSANYAPSSASVTIVVAPAPTVSITPPSASLNTNQSCQFTATVTGATDTSVTWSVQPGGAGGTISSAGLYTAPATIGTDTVIATSNADPSVFAAAIVTVTASGPVTVSVAETITATDTPTIPDTLDQETIAITDTPVIVAMPALEPIAAPVAYYSVGSVGFGTVAPGQTATQAFTLSNIGEEPLVLSAVVIGQSASCLASPVPCFSQPQVLCTNGAQSLPTTLPPAGGCLVAISYLAPSGTPPNGTITFTDNATLSNLPSSGSGLTFMQTLVLNGSGGDAPPPPVPPATVYVTDMETITVTDAPMIPDVLDEEMITITDTPVILVTPAR